MYPCQFEKKKGLVNLPPSKWTALNTLFSNSTHPAKLSPSEQFLQPTFFFLGKTLHTLGGVAQERRPGRSPTYLGRALISASMHCRITIVHERTEQLRYEEVNKTQTESVPKHCVVLLCCTALGYYAKLLLHCAHHFFPLATLTCRSLTNLVGLFEK